MPTSRSSASSNTRRLLLLLVYLSLLVQHVILARKYRRFTDAIAPYEMETGTEHPARERVHSYVFSQIAAGPKPNLITKFMMQLIVYVTFSVLPIITLLYFQIKFLPYHDVSITYWHRHRRDPRLRHADPAHAAHAEYRPDAADGTSRSGRKRKPGRRRARRCSWSCSFSRSSSASAG